MSYDNADAVVKRGVRPGGVARSADVPHGDDVVDPVEAVDDPVEERERPRQVRRLHLRLHACEQAVHALEVGVLRRRAAQLDAELLAGRDERHGQVAVDVHVHPGEGELQRRDAAA